ncbi:MAG: hypothetical protein NVS2B17_03840 [Candidatus Velthaea sp.]
MSRLVALALAIALALCMPLPTLAAGGTTGQINGIIIDAATGGALAGVTVRAQAPTGGSTAKSDTRGFFSLLGLQVDTYTVVFQIPGYEQYILSGVTIEGDQQQTLSIKLSKSLQKIGRVTARAGGAFQPTQTQDAYTVSGKGLQTALGKSNNTEERQLLASVPSVTINTSYFPTIRGSLRTEVGYQLDGIDYTDSYTNQFAYSLRQSGIASLQVVPGAGDPSQGNSGAGSVNFTVKRGTRPAFGSLDFETLTFPFNHQFSADYGWATPDGRISNYTSFYGRRNDYQYGQRGSDATRIQRFYNVSADQLNDFQNNFVYKFGKDKNQSLQFLYAPRVANFQIGYGFNGTDFKFKTADPYALSLATRSVGLNAAQYQSLVPLFTDQPAVDSNLPYQPSQIQPSDLLKLEYTNAFNSNTYFTNRIYRLVSSGHFKTFYTSAGLASSEYDQQGSSRTGVSGELTKQFGSRNNLTLSYKFEYSKAFYDQDSNIAAVRALGQLGNDYELADFLPGGASCPAAGGKFAFRGGIVKQCGYLLSNGIAPGTRVPIYHAITTAAQSTFGVGLRDVIDITNNLKVDIGLRSQNANLLGLNGSGYDDKAIHPHLLEPRFGASYRVGARDGVRVSFGRSSSTPALGNVQTLVDPRAFTPYYNIKSYDNRSSAAPGSDAARAMVCGPNFKAVCSSYGAQLHDEFVNVINGPEETPAKPTTFTNIDASYQHAFGRGFAARITPFFRRGYDVIARAQPQIGSDPTTGAPIFGPAVTTNLGVNKTTGVEFLATKESTVPDGTGFSGFLSATYINEFTNVPPTAFNQSGDIFPTIPPAALLLGNLYHAAYNPPLQVQSGINYKTKNGFRLNPVINYNRGVPIGSGLISPTFVNNVAVNIPSSNASTVGNGPISLVGSSAYAFNYVDPMNPGSVFKPNVAATRGTPEAASPGGILSRPRITADSYFEYSKPGSRNTFGIGVLNMFNQIYSQPVINDRYQPVTTGVSGPLSGFDTRVITNPGIGFTNYGPESFGTKPYLLLPNGPFAAQPAIAGTTVRLYYQVAF